MSDFHIVELDTTTPKTDPGAILVALQAVHELYRAEQLAKYGNDDQTNPVDVMLAEREPNAQRENVILVALRSATRVDAALGRNGLPLLRPGDRLNPDDLLGAAEAVLPLTDNLNSVWDISIDVATAHRRRGLGRSLSQAIDSLARTRGRSVLHAWSDAREADLDDLNVLEPSAGGHRIARDGSAEFMTAMGYRLAQADQHSVQDVAGKTFAQPLPPAGYRIVTWHGAAPDWCQPKLATLQSAMSTDTPLGDFAYDEEHWDAARYAEWESRVLGTREMIVSLAVHETSGQAAGFSQLIRPTTRPAVVEQWNTLVARQHRGHGLGLAIKQANLALLGQVWPDAERVHTWNATENDYMLAINERLGYQTQNIGAGWQKKLD